MMPTGCVFAGTALLLGSAASCFALLSTNVPEPSDGDPGDLHPWSGAPPAELFAEGARWGPPAPAPGPRLRSRRQPAPPKEAAPKPGVLQRVLAWFQVPRSVTAAAELWWPADRWAAARLVFEVLVLDAALLFAVLRWRGQLMLQKQRSSSSAAVAAAPQRQFCCCCPATAWDDLPKYPCARKEPADGFDGQRGDGISGQERMKAMHESWMRARSEGEGWAAMKEALRRADMHLRDDYGEEDSEEEEECEVEEAPAEAEEAQEEAPRPTDLAGRARPAPIRVDGLDEELDDTVEVDGDYDDEEEEEQPGSLSSWVQSQVPTPKPQQQRMLQMQRCLAATPRAQAMLGPGPTLLSSTRRSLQGKATPGLGNMAEEEEAEGEEDAEAKEDKPPRRVAPDEKQAAKNAAKLTLQSNEFLLALQKRRIQVDAAAENYEKAPAVQTAHYSWDVPLEDR